MSEEEKNQLEIKLHTELAESLAKTLNIPVFVINPEVVNKIILEEGQTATIFIHEASSFCSPRPTD